MSVTQDTVVRTTLTVQGLPEYIAQMTAARAATLALNGTKATIAIDDSAAKLQLAGVQNAATKLASTNIAMKVETAGLNDANVALKAMDGNAKGVVTTLLGVSGAAVGILAVGAAFTVAAKEAMTFQQTMANLQAVLHAPPTDLANLGSSIQQNSRDTIFTANQIAEADRLMAKAGQDANQIMSEQRDVLNLSSATMSTAADGATAYVTAMKDFNLTNKDSTTIADDLAKAVDSSIGTLADMQDALKQVGPVAAQAGLDLKQTTVAIADLQNAGLQGDSGTALKIFLQRLEAPTAAARKAMSDLGIQAYDAAGNLKSLMDIADQLQQKTQGLTDEQKNLDLTKIFGARGVRVADVFATQGSAGMQDVISHENQIGDASEIAATKLNTLSGEMHQLSSSANVVAVNIGSAMTPSLTDAATAATTLFNALAKVTSGLNSQGDVGNAAKKFSESIAISADPQTDIANQEAYVERLKALRVKAADDARRPWDIGFLGTHIFKSTSDDLKGIDADIAKATTDLEKYKTLVDSQKEVASTQLQQNVGAIISDQNARDARLGNAPDTMAQVATNARNAKAYIDSFKDAFISSGHSIQEWQVIEKNAFQDIDKNAKSSADNFKSFEEQRLQTLLDNNAKAHALDLQGAPTDLVNRAIFGNEMGLSASQIVKAKNDLKDWQATADAAGKSATDQFKLVNQAFDGTIKALDGIKQNKGIDGLLTSLKSLKAEQANLTSLGIQNQGLTDIIAMGQAFQTLADQEAQASSQFDSYMAASAHTDTYIKKIDDTKSHYASLEQYIKDKPLSARTQDDITFLDKYNQRLATLNNMEDQLKERQVVDANNASSVIPNFSYDDAQYRATLAQFGGEVGVKVRLDVDVQQATEAASKADYLLQQIAEHPHNIALTLTGNVAAEEALQRIQDGEDAAHAKADIVVIAKAEGITDVQTLSDLIAGVRSKTVDITANVNTAYSSSGTLPAAGTTPSFTPGQPFAKGGRVAGDMAIVGDTKSGDMSAAEVVDFRNRRVYSHDDSVRRGWLGGNLPRYAKGTSYDDGGQPVATVDANDPTATTGPYTAGSPGPAGDLSKPFKNATVAANQATAAVSGTAAAVSDLTTKFIDATIQSDALSRSIAHMDSTGVKAVTTEYTAAYDAAKKLAEASFTKATGKGASQANAAEKSAMDQQAATGAVNYAVAFAAAMQQARDPTADLSAAFQKLRDTGNPLAENAIRWLSVQREIYKTTADQLAAEQEMKNLEASHTSQHADDQKALDGIRDRQTAEQALEQQQDEAATRAMTRQQWQQDAERTARERAYQEEVRQRTDLEQRMQKEWQAQQQEDARQKTIRDEAFQAQTRQRDDTKRLADDAWTTEQRRLADERTQIERGHTATMDALTDEQKALDAAHKAAAGGNTARNQLLQAQVAGDTTSGSRAADSVMLAIGTQQATEADTNYQTATAAIKAATDAETEHEKQVLADLADQTTRETRAHEDWVKNFDLQTTMLSRQHQDAEAAITKQEQAETQSHQDILTRMQEEDQQRNLDHQREQERQADADKARQIADQEARWALADRRAQVAAGFKAETDAATDLMKQHDDDYTKQKAALQSRIDQDTASLGKLKEEQDYLTSVRDLWKQVYDVAGESANQILSILQGAGPVATKPVAPALALGNVPGHADGGIAQGLFRVGERGAELMYSAVPMTVIPHVNAQQMIAGGGTARPPTNFAPTFVAQAGETLAGFKARVWPVIEEWWQGNSPDAIASMQGFLR